MDFVRTERGLREKEGSESKLGRRGGRHKSDDGAVAHMMCLIAEFALRSVGEFETQNIRKTSVGKYDRLDESDA